MSESSPSKSNMKETLSALLDNEAGKLDGLELLRLSKNIEQDEVLVKTYQRYAAVSAVMRGEALNVSQPTQLDFLNGVKARIKQEQLMVKKVAFGGGAGKRVSQLALAASVAVMTVFLVQYNNQQNGTALASSAAQTIDYESTIQTPGSQSSVNSKLGSTSNRVLTPQVLSVGAGSLSYGVSNVEQGYGDSAVQSNCTAYNGGELAATDWLVQLPDGVALCYQQEESRQQKENRHCKAFASALVCRFK